MSIFKKRCLSFILAALLFALAGLPMLVPQAAAVYATETEQELANLKAEQDRLAEQLAKAQEELAIFQSEQDLSQTSLAWLMERDEEQRKAYEEQLEIIAGITKIKKSLDKNLELAIQKYDHQKQVYGQRVEAMFHMQNKSQLEILLESKDLTAYFTTLRLMKMISDADEQDLKNLRQARDELVQKRAETEKQLADLEVIRAGLEKDLSAIKNDIAGYESSINNLDSEMQSRYDAIKAFTEQDYEIQMSIQAAEQKAAEERLREELARAQNQAQNGEQGGEGADQGQEAPGVGSPNPSNGAWVWPCPSSAQISSEFGYRNIPEFGINDFHTGLDIAANYNVEAVAAAAGTVIYASWMDFGGNTVKIDVGGGLVTMYCHLNGFAVSVGQQVTPGQVVGYVGSTGNSTGPHLHFEVDQNGTPVDPRLYLN